jgi:hypothetical protein
MFAGYLVLDGEEIINNARVTAYVNHAIPSMGFKDPTDSGDDLPLVTGDGKYESPMVDAAPWVDPGDPDTYNFYGVMGLARTTPAPARYSRAWATGPPWWGCAGRARRSWSARSWPLGTRRP